MAFKAIVLSSPQGDGELPWLSKLLETNPEFDGNMYQVLVVAFSEKGVMVTTEFFKSFLYRSNPYYAFLQEALEVWTTNNVPVHALMVLVDSQEKSKIKIGVEDSLESNWEKKSSTLFKLRVGMQNFSSTLTGKNPLLVVSSSTASPKESRRRGKAGSGGQADLVGKAAESLAKATSGEVTIEESFDEAWDFVEPPRAQS